MTNPTPDTDLNAAVIYNQLRKGDPLTDAQVEYGIHFFDNLRTLLGECGLVFCLANSEATHMYYSLSDVQRARKSK